MKQRRELRWAGHGTALAYATLLELAFVAVRPRVGPLFAGIRLSRVEVQLSPPFFRQRQVVLGQADRLFRPQRREVEAPVERHHTRTDSAVVVDSNEQGASLRRVGHRAPV